MPYKKWMSGVRNILLILFLVAFNGCINYRIETTLRSDGGGRRTVTVEMTDAKNLNKNVTRQEFVELMSLTEDKGWVYHVEVQDDGDTVHVFDRETEIADLDSWSDLNDELHISGSLPATADSTLGYVTAGDVHFRNRLRVSSSGGIDGTASFRYQESFSWENGIDAFVEGLVAGMEKSVQEAYPNLTDRERGEILGVARVRLWSAIEGGIFDSNSDDEDRLLEEALDGMTAVSIKILRTKYPNATEEALRERLDLFSDDFEGEDPTDTYDRLLPGLASGGGSITFHLTMPGRVTTTNAHEKDGNRLTWEFSTDDAIAAPVVLVAESVVGG